MTTEAAANLYLAQHLYANEGKRIAVHNPNNTPLDQLPVIYGFNNGGSHGWYHAQLMAEDGTALGSHACSHEGYMMSDLGILEGSYPKRHETFRAHYPGGYRMEFVSYNDVPRHEKLMAAIKKNKEKGERAKFAGIGLLLGLFI